MRTGRRNDILSADTQIRERVRKLEVMPQSLASKPREWHNQEHLIHLYAELVYLQSHWFEATHTDTTELPYPKSSVGRQAQQLYDLMMTDGYGSSSHAQHWTGLLLACGAIMHPEETLEWSAANPWPTGAPPPTGGAGELPAFVAVADCAFLGGGDDTEWFTRDNHRLCIWTGLTEGEWHYEEPGVNIGGPGFPPMPSSGGLVIDGHTVYRPGNWYRTHEGSHSAVYWTGTNNTVYYQGFPAEPYPCYDPGATPSQPPMNGHNPGGQPIDGTYTDGCPNNPVENVAEGGALTGAYVILPDADAHLMCPPSPWSAGQAVSRVQTQFAIGSVEWPDLIELVEAALPYFPGVIDWVEQRKNLKPQRKQWHRMHRYPRGQGWVEAQVRDRQVVLRGGLRIISQETPAALVLFDERQVPPPSYTGQLYHLRVQASHGGVDHGTAWVSVRPWPDHTGFPHIWYLDIGRIEGWTTAEDADYELTLHFDGAHWPTDTTLY